jgi:YHS domain-containing protein
MSEYRDIEDMIEVLDIAIIRQETEEQFFQRSANASTSEFSRTMFSQISEELAAYVKTLEERREKLAIALNDLKAKGSVGTAMGNYITVDPVCSMPIGEKCNYTSVYKGKEYRFCTEDCKKAFDIDPEKYIKT